MTLYVELKRPRQKDAELGGGMYRAPSLWQDALLMALIDNLIQALQVLPGVGLRCSVWRWRYCSETVAAAPSWVIFCCRRWVRASLFCLSESNRDRDLPRLQ